MTLDMKNFCTPGLGSPTVNPDGHPIGQLYKVLNPFRRINLDYSPQKKEVNPGKN